MAIGDRQSITMGKDIFYVQQFPAFEGMRVLGELQKLVLPAVGGVSMGIEQGEENGILAGMMMLSENIDAEKLESLSKMLINPGYVSVKVEGKGAAVPLDENMMNQIFTGRYLDILVLMYEIAKVNFLDFRKLCGLPIGVVTAIEGIKLKFRANLAENLSETALSSAPLKAE